MGPKKDNDSSKVKRRNTNIMIDVKKEIIAKHEKMVFVSLILLLSLGWQNQRSVVFLKTESQSRKQMLKEE